MIIFESFLYYYYNNMKKNLEGRSGGRLKKNRNYSREDLLNDFFVYIYIYIYIYSLDLSHNIV